MTDHKKKSSADAPGYYEHFVTRERNGFGKRVKTRIANRIVGLAELPAQATVFELGPGDGDIASIVTGRGHHYSAMDASPAIVRSLVSRGFAVTQGFAPPLPESPGQIDAMFAMHVIEHMTPMSVQELLETARARLTPRGRIVIATPDYARWGHHFYDSDYTHINPFTGRKLKQTLEAAGLQVLSQELQIGAAFGHAFTPVAWLARRLYTATLQDALRRLSGNDLPGRAFLTLLPNLVAVAGKG